MMILEQKRRDAWIKRRAELWRVVERVVPYEIGWEMFGAIYYYRTEFVEFIVVERDNEIQIEQLWYFYNGYATRFMIQPLVVIPKRT